MDDDVEWRVIWSGGCCGVCLDKAWRKVVFEFVVRDIITTMAVFGINWLFVLRWGVMALEALARGFSRHPF